MMGISSSLSSSSSSSSLSLLLPPDEGSERIRGGGGADDDDDDDDDGNDTSTTTTTTVLLPSSSSSSTSFLVDDRNTSAGAPPAPRAGAAGVVITTSRMVPTTIAASAALFVVDFGWGTLLRRSCCWCWCWCYNHVLLQRQQHQRQRQQRQRFDDDDSRTARSRTRQPTRFGRRTGGQQQQRTRGRTRRMTTTTITTTTPVGLLTVMFLVCCCCCCCCGSVVTCFSQKRPIPEKSPRRRRLIGDGGIGGIGNDGRGNDGNKKKTISSIAPPQSSSTSTSTSSSSTTTTTSPIPKILVPSSYDEDDDDDGDDTVSAWGSFGELRQKVMDELRIQDDNDFHTASMLITSMMEYYWQDDDLDVDVVGGDKDGTAAPAAPADPSSTTAHRRRQLLEIIDESLQAFYARAFVPPFRGRRAWDRVSLAIDLLNLQLSSSSASVSSGSTNNTSSSTSTNINDGVLEVPYGTVPRGVLVKALQAVTGLLEGPPPTLPSQPPPLAIAARPRHRRRLHSQQQQPKPQPPPRRNYDYIGPDIAFRLLQRLITGVGVRNVHRHHRPTQGATVPKPRPVQPHPLYEVDFNRVLNVYSNRGQMDMAHRVIALQERTPHAPSLSPVTYSILLKGYGRLGDCPNVDMLIRHGAASGLKPDTILFNSMMDAYVNCNRLDKARMVLNAMLRRRERLDNGNSIDYDDDDDDDDDDDFPFAPQDCPPPQVRTYNIFLKGLARQGLWEEAQSIANEMMLRQQQQQAQRQRRGTKATFWDYVTTNTLVQAACKAGDFDAAEALLEQHTVVLPVDEAAVVVDGDDKGSRRGRPGGGEQQRRHQNHQQHPNADAYTSLMDGLGKEGMIERAVALLRLMKERNVQANEYHYSSLIGALARSRQIGKARKMLSHVRSIPTIRNYTVIYNSLISGIVVHHSTTDQRRGGLLVDDEYDAYVDEALSVLRSMIEQQVTPDVGTITVVLDAFGRCQRPRLVEAVTLVEKLEAQRILPPNHVKICTALIRVFSAANDLEGAAKVFRKIRCPDLPAVNALLDASVRFGKHQVATETFRYYFERKSEGKTLPVLKPDVISYSTLIRAALSKGTLEGPREARKLYEEMKFQRRIFPDKVLVNIIVRGLVEASRMGGSVQAADARFVASVLRDAERLDWGDGQLERRKRVTEHAMRTSVGTAWDEEAGLYGLWKDPSNKFDKDDQKEDNIFERHGWNQVDSGFRLWGAGKNVEPPGRPKTDDEFLRSKGWNDMESGFRII